MDLAEFCLSSGLSFQELKDIHSLHQFTSAIASTASKNNEVTSFAAFCLAGALGATATAAWYRNRPWVVVGLTNGSIFALVLILVVAKGTSNLDETVATTHERIGSITLIKPADETTKGSRTPAQPELLQADAEAATRDLIATIETTAGSPPLWRAPDTQKATQVTWESIPLVTESCAPAPENRVGTRLGVKFETKISPDGSQVQAIEQAITEAGYKTADQTWSKVFIGAPNLPLAEVIVHDSSSMNETVTITITTNCVNADSTQPSDATP